MIIAFKNNVINIYYEIDTPNTRVMVKNKIFFLIVSHTKLLNNIVKFSKPSPRILLEAI